MQGESDDENTIRILVATDCHLGYAEKDGVRHSDSLVTFEEILQHAKRQKADLILLGGDLFHENKPSRKSLHGCMALIRQYCMGERPVPIEFLSDQSVNFAASPFPMVNYEDPNLNVEIPVFSIHGNHDDPAGLGNLCALDVLSVSGLVNYFGKSNTLESVEISPLLMQKGSTKMSLYGLGSIRDERLHRMFVNDKIKVLRPKEGKDAWFNLFVIHQNRAKHGETNYIPEEFLPDLLDLVVWGHEHECIAEPVWNSRRNFYIIQPGSSIATSLSPGEAVKKHVSLLQVRGKAMKCTKIALETVRPFYIEDVVLRESDDLDPEDHKIAEKVEAYCKEKVESMIARAEAEHTGNDKQPKLPLIRLRVDYSGGFDTFNANRFGQKFVNKVANPKDIILFQRKKAQVQKKDKESAEEMANYFRPEALDAGRVEDLVKTYFAGAEEKNQLSLLSEKGLGQAVQEFVDKAEKDAIIELVTFQLEKTQKLLQNRKATEENIAQELKKFKVERKHMSDADESKEIKQVMEKVKEQRQNRGETATFSDEDMNSDSNSDAESTSTSTRGKGRGRGRGKGRGSEVSRGGNASRGGRGSKGGRGSRGGRGASQTASGRSKQSLLTDNGASFLSVNKKPPAKSKITFQDSESDENEDFSPPSTKKRPRPKNTTVSGRLVVTISDSDDEVDPFSSKNTTSQATKRSRRR